MGELGFLGGAKYSHLDKGVLVGSVGDCRRNIDRDTMPSNPRCLKFLGSFL